MHRAVLVFILLAGIADAQHALRDGFLKPPEDCKIMVRWWWFGPAVTHAELAREMRLMKQGGIGGFEVQPTYPLQLDGNLPYLSKEFLDTVRFTAQTARELGLRMDMTLGSGWPYGGPHITPELAAKRVRVRPLPPTGEYDLTRQMVKRAAVGAEGYVLDHYSRAALDKHLEVVGEKLADAAGPGSIRAMFCDSLEVYGADWTPDFLEQFQKRRGYDLKPYLNALVQDIGEKTASIRHDYGQTLTELFEERFLAPLEQWCHRHKTLLRMQGYGTPPSSLSSYRFVDLPEGEGAGWNDFSTSRWASSAGHNLKRPVTSSETWTWIHSPVFRATPLDFKAEADQHFLEGITQFVGHGWPYSPPEAGNPGWRFYAAGVMNEHNPWWPVMPELTAYLQRVSFLLRQGEPANDIGLYAPTDDAWAEFRAGRVSLSDAIRNRIGHALIPLLLAAGYNFDLVDDAAVGDARHRMVVLPGVERIPPATVRKLQAFARRGGIVVATRRVPDEFRKFAKFFPEENGTVAPQLAKLLHPDVVFSTPAPQIGFVHRKTAAEDIYFLANTGNMRQNVLAEFRGARGNPEWWDPFTGEITAAQMPVRLELEPYESRILVFSKHAGTRRKPAPAHAPAAIDLSRRWQVTIGEHTVSMDRLRSWTDDPQTQYYSGAATYRKQFTVPTEMEGRPLKLNFGEATPVTPGKQHGSRAWVESPVREAAEVFVNGKRAGAVWHPPYDVEVSGLLRAGENELRIVVYNLAINQMAGEPLPDYTALNARYGKRFDPQDLENLKPLPSGILGPVRLIPY